MKTYDLRPKPVSLAELAECGDDCEKLVAQAIASMEDTIPAGAPVEIYLVLILQDRTGRLVTCPTFDPTISAEVFTLAAKTAIQQHSPRAILLITSVFRKTGGIGGWGFYAENENGGAHMRVLFPLGPGRRGWTEDEKPIDAKAERPFAFLEKETT